MNNDNMNMMSFEISDSNVDALDYYPLWFYTAERWDDGFYQYSTLTFFTPYRSSIYYPVDASLVHNIDL